MVLRTLALRAGVCGDVYSEPECVEREREIERERERESESESERERERERARGRDREREREKREREREREREKRERERDRGERERETGRESSSRVMSMVPPANMPTAGQVYEHMSTLSCFNSICVCFVLCFCTYIDI